MGVYLFLLYYVYFLITVNHMFLGLNCKHCIFKVLKMFEFTISIVYSIIGLLELFLHTTYTYGKFFLYSLIGNAYILYFLELEIKRRKPMVYFITKVNDEKQQ